MPQTAGMIPRQEIQLSEESFSPSEIHNQRTSIGDSLVASDRHPHTLACYCETYRVGAAMLQIRWAIPQALSVPFSERGR